MRFYVKREIAPNVWRSEVAFTKLFFPKIALTLVAKGIYKENYETTKMRHQWSEKDNLLHTSYGLKKSDWHHFELITETAPKVIHENTDEHFFSKHYWGTSQINNKTCTTYEIEHPTWKAHPVKDYNINFDFAQVFGNDFAHLTNQKPSSIQLFDGSHVVVKKKKVI